MLVLAACSGGEERLDVSALRRLVVQPADLPAVFVRFDHGRQVRADTPDWADPEGQRFGRLDGWKARFRRSGTPATKGPLVIESRADVFDSVGGAEDELDAARAALHDSTDVALGEEAAFSMTVQGDVRFFTLVWRQANVLATVRANGFELERQQVIALARLQERRITAELERSR